MNYYIDYKVRYPWLDRIIHWMAHVLFVVLVVVVLYAVEVLVVFNTATHGDLDLVHVWAEYGTAWLVSVPMLVVPAIGGLVALIHPGYYRTLGLTCITSTILPTINRIE